MQLDLNAPGAIQALLAMHRRTFGALRMEDDPAPPAPDPAPPAPDPEPDRGFPENTPLTEMTGEQREAYWKFQARKHEGVVKSRADYDELKQRAAEADRLRKERETESEKAVREARETAAAEERARVAPRLVSAEFRAAAKGVLTAEQTTALLEDLDLTKYLDDKGEVDTAKVERKVTAFAPKKDDGKKHFPDLGQGKRDTAPKTSVASGREMYQARRR